MLNAWEADRKATICTNTNPFRAEAGHNIRSITSKINTMLISKLIYATAAAAYFIASVTAESEPMQTIYEIATGDSRFTTLGK